MLKRFSVSRFSGPAPSRNLLTLPLIAPAAGQGAPRTLQLAPALRAGPQEQPSNQPTTTASLLSESGSETDEEQDDPLASILDAEVQGDEGNKPALGPLAGLGSIGGIVLLLGVGALLKDNVRDFLVGPGSRAGPAGRGG